MDQIADLETDLALDVDREQFFVELYYRVFPSVAKFVHSRSGSIDDAKDLFHDALILHYEKKLQGVSYQSDEAYLIGIVKHLWSRKFNEQGKVSFTNEEALLAIPDDFEPEADTMSILHVLELSGKKCLKLLQDFYYHNKPLDLIKTGFGFSSVRSATVQKFKCLERVRDVVKTKSKRYEDFFE
jgi:hypothetical protein